MATSMALNGRVFELSQTSDDKDRSAPFLIITSIILMLPVTTKWSHNGPSALDRRRETLQARIAGLTILRKLFGAGRWNRISESSGSERHAGEKRHHDDRRAPGMG